MIKAEKKSDDHNITLRLSEAKRKDGIEMVQEKFRVVRCFFIAVVY